MRTFYRIEQSLTLDESESRSEVGMTCIRRRDGISSRTAAVVGGRTVYKIIPFEGFKDEQQLDFKFLELPTGPFDIIEHAQYIIGEKDSKNRFREKYVFMVAASSYSFDPDNKNKFIYSFIPHYYLDTYIWIYEAPPPGNWVQFSIGNLNPSAIFVTSLYTYVSFSNAASDTQIWSNTQFNWFTYIDKRMIKDTPFRRVNTKLSSDEVEIKIHMNEFENYLIYYAVTESEKLTAFNIGGVAGVP